MVGINHQKWGGLFCFTHITQWYLGCPKLIQNSLDLHPWDRRLGHVPGRILRFSCSRGSNSGILLASSMAKEQTEMPSGKCLQNYGKSPFLMGKSTMSMAMLNSYVKLPGGTQCLHRLRVNISAKWKRSDVSELSNVKVMLQISTWLATNFLGFLSHN